MELRADAVKQQFPGVWKRVETIEDQYRDLWTFWIGMDRGFAHRAAAVVRSLEDQIGIHCDEVFEETYLFGIPGYRENVYRGKRVRDVWSAMEPKVEEMLVQQSALDGQQHVDDAVILRAITAAAAQPVPKSAKISDDQVKLFAPEEKSNADPGGDSSGKRK